jgi:hypothetical protein
MPGANQMEPMMPRKILPLRTVTILPALLLAVLGMSCATDGKRPVFPVRGQVLFENKPTPGALVILHPLNDPDPRAPRPVARVGADGRFSPTTYSADDGAPAGEYAVTVAWVKETDNQNAPREEQKQPRNLVPDHYGKPETSGLRVQIKEGHNDLAPFRLTRK